MSARSLVRIRLVGGPFDGVRDCDYEPAPDRLYAEACKAGCCRAHLYEERVSGAEIYTRSTEDEHGWLRYLHLEHAEPSDETLTVAQRQEFNVGEREKIPA